ncbi:MAG: hypothetical protein R2800_13240 [Flavipsychrobacter sp.]
MPIKDDIPEFYVSHNCDSCNQSDCFAITKKEAAFMLVDPRKFDNIPCTVCGSKSFSSWGYSMCELDKELFLEWANDEDLFFLDQDEDLIIADEKYLDIILYLIDNRVGLESKRQILLSALCVIVYDNITSDGSIDEVNDLDLANRVVEELKIRKSLLLALKEWVISDYIKDKVYPLVGI